MVKYVTFAVVVLVLLGGIYVVTQNSYQTPQPAPIRTPQVTKTPSVAPNPSAMMEKKTTTKDFVITGSPYKFDPAQMKVKKGDTVKITFKNAQGMHNFVIDEFNVSTKQLKAGQEETVEFVADKTGLFEYYCSVGNHRAMGMKGMLVVE